MARNILIVQNYNNYDIRFINSGEYPASGSVPIIEKLLEELKKKKYSKLIICGGIYSKDQVNVSLAEAVESTLRVNFQERFKEKLEIEIQIENKGLTMIESVELLMKNFLSQYDCITVLTHDFCAPRIKLIWTFIAKIRIDIIIAKTRKSWWNILLIFFESIDIIVLITYVLGLKSFEENDRKTKKENIAVE